MVAVAASPVPPRSTRHVQSLRVLLCQPHPLSVPTPASVASEDHSNRALPPPDSDCSVQLVEPFGRAQAARSQHRPRCVGLAVLRRSPLSNRRGRGGVARAVAHRLARVLNGVHRHLRAEGDVTMRAGAVRWRRAHRLGRPIPASPVPLLVRMRVAHARSPKRPPPWPHSRRSRAAAPKVGVVPRGRSARWRAPWGLAPGCTQQLRTSACPRLGSCASQLFGWAAAAPP